MPQQTQRGDMALTDANPAMPSLETKLGSLDKHSEAWTSILALGLGFWTLDKNSGPLIRILAMWPLD